MGEIIFLSVVIAACGVLYGVTFTFNVSSFDTTGGPAPFPRYVLIGIILVGVALIVRRIRERGDDRFAFLELFHGSRGVGLLAFVVYLILLRLIGFFIATTIFLAVTCHYLLWVSSGSWAHSSVRVVARVGVLALAAFGIYYLFGQVFNIMLPTGTLF